MLDELRARSDSWYYENDVDVAGDVGHPQAHPYLEAAQALSFARVRCLGPLDGRMDWVRAHGTLEVLLGAAAGAVHSLGHAEAAVRDAAVAMLSRMEPVDLVPYCGAASEAQTLGTVAHSLLCIRALAL